MKRLYPILSALLLLAACAESDTDRAVTQQLQNSPDFHATFESDDTRTFVDEKVRLLWTEGDQLSIFTSTLNQKYEFDGETGDNSGTFTPISSGQFGSGSSLSVDANFAVYPYNQSTKISYDGELSIELPSTQAYAEDSFGVNANTMVAATKSQNDYFLSFKNLGGFLKLQLYGDATIKSIQLEGNNGEKIAGGATVTAKYGKNPTLTMDSDATTSITLDCGAGVKLSASSSSATEFWIVVPPVTFSKGFTITITDTEGGTMTKSTTKSYTVERNVIKSMAAFKVETTDPTTPPANEIWYTSIDGKIVEPYSDANHQASSSFDANIVSNVYKDGKGIITFDKDVTTIGRYAFFARYNLESIVLPNGITSIGDYAFTNCNSLKNVVISNSVTSIGAYAFAYCATLSDISIPNGVTTIKSYAFAGCSSLTSITIPNSVIDIGDGAFRGCESLAAFYGKYASADNRCLIVNGVLNSFAPVGLTSYSIPNIVTTIGESAFDSCFDLTSVTIPNSVTSIGLFAFNNCGLTSITIPDSVTSIGAYSFSGCLDLKYATIGKGVLSIGDCAFNGAAITSINIPDTVASLGHNIFRICSSLTTILGKYASSDHRCLIVDGVLSSFASANITSYTIPEGVTSIGVDAFFNCMSLIDITIPESVTEIGSYAFGSCPSLANVNIPNSVMKIGDYSFVYCSSLTSITIPERVTSIGQSAFLGCDKLKDVYCKPATPPSCRNYVFEGNTYGRKIYVPTSSVDAYKSSDGWSAYASDIVGYNFDDDAESEIPNNQIWYTSTDGKVVGPNDPMAFGANITSNIYKDGKGIISFDKDILRVGDYAFQSCSELVSIDIPNKVTEIGTWAFLNCDNLERVAIPYSVVNIDDAAFSGCYNLTEISIPDKVKYIGTNAFSTTGITSITIPENATLGGNIVSDCWNLRSIYGQYASSDNRCWVIGDVLEFFAPAGLTEYAIPEGIKTIGREVFRRSQLSNIILPNSLKTIGYNAFNGCRNLTDIDIPDGVEDIGMTAFSQCYNLANISLPNSVRNIGIQAFSGCSSLAQITIPQSVDTIGYGVFRGCSSLVAFYGKYASEDNRALIIDGNLLAFASANINEYTIPYGVTKIGEQSFSGSKLSKITIPSSVTTIAFQAFDQCHYLESVIIPVGVKHIEGCAFMSCDELKDVTIPSSVTDIEAMAFSHCRNLEVANCKPTTPPSITRLNGISSINIFNECNKLRTINVPHESVANYKNASGWSECSDKIVGCEFFGDYAGTEVPNNQIWYTSSDERVVQTMKSAFGATIVSNVYENGRGVITCDRDIQIVGKEAFGRSPLLLGVALPESVTTIDANAFAYTGIKSITIPKNVTSIGTMAFADCRDLRSFYGKYASGDNRSLRIDGCLIAFAPAGLTYYSTPPGTTKIGDAAFWGCSNLGGIEMGENVKEIGAEAFYGCSSLESFHLPQFVMKVGARAFAYCGGLWNVTIPEYAIEIGKEAFLKCVNLTDVHCRPANPPSIGSKLFGQCDKLTRIEVPHKSIDSYKAASGWSEYADKIDGDV